jgi:hypothetical protein
MPSTTRRRDQNHRAVSGHRDAAQARMPRALRAPLDLSSASVCGEVPALLASYAGEVAPGPSAGRESAAGDVSLARPRYRSAATPASNCTHQLRPPAPNCTHQLRGGISLGAWWWLRRPTPVIHSTGTSPGLALAPGAGRAARVGKGPRHRRPRPAPSTPCRSCTQSPWSWPRRQCPVPHAAVTKTTAP